MVKNTSKNLLIIINGLGVNGAPIYALDVAKILKQNGYEITVWSMSDGNMKSEFDKLISCDIVDYYSNYNNLKSMISKYDGAILFTIQTYLFYEVCCSNIPTIWYIHEGKNLEEYLDNDRCRYIFSGARNIICVSEYAQKIMQKEYSKKSDVIHNFVEDMRCIGNEQHRIEGKVKFLTAGSMCPRKGFDVLVEAFEMLETNIKRNSEIIICGEQSENDYTKKLLAKIEGDSNIINLKEISRENLFKEYQDIDVVVIPSRDESCSLVALEALMYGKPVIISDAVGAAYLVNDLNGWVFESENTKQLSKIIYDIIGNKYDLNKMGIAAREAYEAGATKELFEKQFLNIINKYIYGSCVKNYFIKINSIYRRHIRNKNNPFFRKEIAKNSRIVLYGAGKYGNAWHTILSESNYVRIVGWVDKYATREGVGSIEQLKIMDFDYVFITIGSPRVVLEVKRELQQYVDSDRILVQSECSNELYRW